MNKMESPYLARHAWLIDILIFAGLIAIVIGIRFARGEPKAIQLEPKKTLGSLNAPVSITVFSDFGCPYCNKIRPVLKQIVDAYPKDLSLAFKHYPLSIHSTAERSAEASECAADQDQFWAYHDEIFDHVQEWAAVKDPDDLFVQYANHLGLDSAAFKTCLESGVKLAMVRANKDEGRRVFVGGTPTCLLNGRKVLTRHTFEYMKEMVEKELSQGAANAL